MQGTALWVDGAKVHPLPPNAPKGRPVYHFSRYQEAITYLLEVLRAFAAANPP